MYIVFHFLNKNYYTNILHLSPYFPTIKEVKLCIFSSISIIGIIVRCFIRKIFHFYSPDYWLNKYMYECYLPHPRQ